MGITNIYFITIILCVISITKSDYHKSKRIHGECVGVDETLVCSGTTLSLALEKYTSSYNFLFLEYSDIKDLTSINNVRNIVFENNIIHDMDLSYNEKSFYFENNTILRISPLLNTEHKISGSFILRYNKIRNVEQGVFKHIDISSIYWDHTELNNIKPGVFKDMIIRDVIDLSYNDISELGHGTFQNVSYKNQNRKFEILIVKSGIDRISSGAFNQIKAHLLNLAKNKIWVLDNAIFTDVVLLKLDLSENLIETIKPKALHGLSLRTLDLSFNKITEFVPNTFEQVKGLYELLLFGNLIQTISGQTFKGLLDINYIDLSNNKLSAVDSKAFEIPNHNQLLDINLENNLLTDVPSKLLSENTYLEKLNLSKNKFSKVNVTSFADLKHLKYLNLSFNELSELKKEVLYPLVNLESLDLSNNKLTSIEIGDVLFHLKNLKTVNINENSWKCSNLKNTVNDMFKNKVNVLQTASKKYEKDNVHGISCIPEDISMANPDLTELQATVSKLRSQMDDILLILRNSNCNTPSIDVRSFS